MMAERELEVEPEAAGSFWLVMSPVGLQVAGTADVAGRQVQISHLPQIRQASIDGPSDLPDDVAALIRLTSTAHPTPPGRLDGPAVYPPPVAATSGPPVAVEMRAPVLLRVDAGAIVAGTTTSEPVVGLDDRHVEWMERVATGRGPFLVDPDTYRSDPALAELLGSGLVSPTAEASVQEPTPSPATPSPTSTNSASPATFTSADTSSAVAGADDDVQVRRRLRQTVQRLRRRRTEGGPGTERSRTLVPVWPVTCADTEIGNALGLGMVIAAAASHQEGRLTQMYDFRPIQITADDALREMSASTRPGVLLLSSYVWSVGANLAFAARVKELSPETIVVIGGPSAPKYAGDAENFFELYPQIDVIVRGEGEVTTCEMLDALGGDISRLEQLTEVRGLTVRVAGRIVRAPERPRLDDLNLVPSPYLTGLFDHLSTQQGIWAVETNRGCPYGCTFCDWGSATRSRIRKYDMDRVTAEFNWLSDHGVQAVFVADANFGIFERDLEITRHVAELHRSRGAPTSFIASFAKNTTKYTVPIIRTLIDSGLSGDVAIAFQTTDDATLDNVNRNNIRIEAYDQLARDVRSDGLPIVADIMIGLPGSNLETLRTDLQHCIESDVTPRVFGTIVLPNSPMNDPDYRRRHRIEVDSFNQVISTTSFGPEDREDIVRFRDVFRWADHFGILRHVIRWEAHRSRRREVDVLSDICHHATTSAARYPLVAFMVRSGRRYMIEPLTWATFYQEVARLLTAEFGAPLSSEMQTVLTVQEALMPTAHHPFPHTVRLEHDYVSFYLDVLRPLEGESMDRRLSSYGPAELTVSDPHGLSPGCLREMFQIEHSPEGARSLRHEGEFWQAFNWELHSPLRRALRDQYYDQSKSLPVLDKHESPVFTGPVRFDEATPAAP